MEKLFIKTGHGMETVGVNLPYFCVKDEGINKCFCAITDERDNMKVVIYKDGTASLFQIHANEITADYEPIEREAFAKAWRAAIGYLNTKYRLISALSKEAA